MAIEDRPMVGPGDTVLSTSAGEAAGPPSIVSRALAVMKRDPVLFVTLAYVSISFIGLWASWWFYRILGLPILDYLQASDFLVAGLREPLYAFALVLTIGIARLIGWPRRIQRDDPQRAAALSTRWWWKVVAPPQRGWYSWWGMAPDTVLVLSVAMWMLGAITGMSIGRAAAVTKGRGAPVVVTLAGSPTPLPGETRLLGTSASFAFLYWPETRRIEAVTIESVARIRALPRRPRGEALPATAR